MAFLDNTGDIILDAVLTDEGRRRLAKGDGSFKIEKFALGDDEIDYSLYNGSHPSGSAYYDLELLKTPVLEAFTNNIASMNSKLVSIPRTNLLFLPVLKLNEVAGVELNTTYLSYIIPVNVTNEDTLNALTSGKVAGTIYKSTKPIRVDQGLDTTKQSYTVDLKNDLLETEYLVTVDGNLCVVTDSSFVEAEAGPVDDDNFITYRFVKDLDTKFITLNPDRSNSVISTNSQQTIKGPRGTILQFKTMPSEQLISGDYLFDLLGPGAQNSFEDATGTYKTIRSNINIYGVNTGYQLDIPITFVKKTA